VQIRWTEPAARDITAICDYIDEHDGPATARKVALRIHERVSSLRAFPQMGRIGQKNGTRELVIPGLPFLAVYRVRDNVIQIIRILHGAQRWP
jgi:addiction module RelE/StbE family toxin